jgi:hypothetical protein
MTSQSSLEKAGNTRNCAELALHFPSDLGIIGGKEGREEGRVEKPPGGQACEQAGLKLLFGDVAQTKPVAAPSITVIGRDQFSGSRSNLL